ncbi:MAG: hypothetical protein ACRC57_00520 [Sarcina sp.]
MKINKFYIEMEMLEHYKTTKISEAYKKLSADTGLIEVTLKAFIKNEKFRWSTFEKINKILNLDSTQIFIKESN